MAAPTLSYRPKARPKNLGDSHAGGRERMETERANNKARDKGGSSKNSPTAAPAAVAAAPAPVARPEPAMAPPPPPPSQEARAADRTALDNMLRERSASGGSYRSTVLTGLYGIADDGKRATRSLQAFNGRNGGTTVLGR